MIMLQWPLSVLCGGFWCLSEWQTFDCTGSGHFWQGWTRSSSWWVHTIQYQWWCAASEWTNVTSITRWQIQHRFCEGNMSLWIVARWLWRAIWFWCVCRDTGIIPRSMPLPYYGGVLMVGNSFGMKLCILWYNLLLDVPKLPDWPDPADVDVEQDEAKQPTPGKPKFKKTSGPKASNPYDADESWLLPIFIAIGVFIPTVICLCRLS